MRSLGRVVLAQSLLLSSIWAGRLITPGPDDVLSPDEVVIRLKPTGVIANVLASFNNTITVTGTQTPLNLYLLKVPAPIRDVILQQLANLDAVEYAEPNRIRSTSALTPDDTSFATQWWLTKMQATGAWSLFPGQFRDATTTGSRVRVAILDTGADCTHPDFINAGGTGTDISSGGQFNWSLSQAIVPTTAVSPACPWQDDHGHGTHTAGIVAAATNNAAGVASLGFPAELMIFKVLDQSGNGTDFDIAQAILAASDNGARVISMSLAGSGYSQSLQDAINYAWRHNVVVVAATGNNNSSSLFYPGDANFALGVGATDSADARASFSNYGFGLDVMAPGVSIYSTYKGGLYATMSGTSMATPNAAAVAALLVASTPNLSADAVMQRMEMSADTPAAGGQWDLLLGYGRVNALLALNGAASAKTGGGLVGQVVDPTGAPIASAAVSLGGVNGTTDANGLFRFANVPPGTYTFAASGGGYPSRSQSVVVPPGADAQVLFTLGIATGTVTGTITSGGQPVPNAVVEALTGGLVEQAAVTNTSGVYTLNVATGTHELRASAVGRSTRVTSGVNVTNGGTLTADFDLPALGTISGIVTDSQSVVVSGAQIAAYNSSDSGGGTSAANGAYKTLGLPAGTYTVEVNSPGHLAAVIHNVVVGDGANVNLNVQLPSSSVVTLLTLSPATVGAGGYSANNTVTISSPAGTGGAVVQLSSGNPAAAQVPPTVTVPEGATKSNPFTITGSAVNANTVVTISASLGGVTKSANVTVMPYLLTSLTLSPTSTGGGNSTAFNRVQLNVAAPVGGAVVNLSSANPAVIVPPTVTIPAGTNVSGYFQIATSNVKVATPVVVTAEYAGTSKTATLTVNPTLLSTLTVSPSAVVGGKSFTYCLVKVDSPAPAGGSTVLLTSTDPVAQPPASITIPAGATTSAVFTIPTSLVQNSTPATITASYGGVSKSVTVTVNPPALYTFYAPATIPGGKTITNAYVTITGPAPTGGAVITLSTSGPALTPPGSVTVPEGATSSGYFQIATSDVSVPTPTTLTASYGGVTKSVTVTVNAPALYSLAVSPTSLVGGKPISTAWVTLDGPAGPSGAAVSIASSSPAATPPANVNIPAGATSSGYFTITTTTVGSTTPVTITATLGSVSKAVTITLTSSGLYAFSGSPTTLTGGNTITNAIVTLSGPAGAGGAVITLTSSNPAVTPPATVTVPAGASNTGYFQIPTSSVSVLTPVNVTASFGGSTKVLSLNVKPPGLYTISLSPYSVAGGQPISFAKVTLDGPAGPSGAVVSLASSDPSAAAPPATVTVAAGTTVSPYFVITTSIVSATTSVTITGNYGGITKQATATIRPPALYSLQFSPSTITGGKSIAFARVILDGPAGPAGAAVSVVSANPALVTVPATVSVPSGSSTSPYFTIDTNYVSAATPVAITASYAGVSKQATLTLKPADLYAFSASPSTVSGGKPITSALVTLDGPAGPAGTVVSLSSSNPLVAPVPATILVPAGAVNTGSFAIQTSAVSVNTPVTFTATLNGISKTATVTVKPVDLYSLQVSPSTFKGGVTMTVKAYLDGPAPPGGAAVVLTSTNAAAPVPNPFVIPAGVTSATTYVTTLPVASSTPVTVTAQFGSVTKSVTVTLTP